MTFLFKTTDFQQAVLVSKAALLAQGLRVVADIPTSEILKTAGFEVESTHQYFFFHPRFMHALLIKNRDAIQSAPLKLVIREPRKGQIEGVLQMAEQAFAAYPEFQEYATDLDQRLRLVFESLAQKI